MNLVLYGFPAPIARSLADRYGFVPCSAFEELEGEGNLLLQADLTSGDEQLAFLQRMERYADRIDAVIAVPCETLSTVYYCSQPGRFFTVGADDEQTQQYELSRIIETSLGMICAHEGI